ncbi:type II toxin-antitoxin system PemK/MazF family toxin [Enterococcus sp. AZ163]|uniref:type II toxin-antitoxin system PemK/MazF family toxin n=1 Tax=Enterococcus sp. AZ163 TaxID=2774638 RepID=UPI003D2B285C
MKRNEIITVYLAFVGKSGGKRRPVVVIEDKKERLEFFSITSKYSEKSERMKRLYYPIKNWKEAGLSKESWIDVGTLRGVSKLDNDIIFKHVGKLTYNDISNLNEFISKLNKI